MPLLTLESIDRVRVVLMLPYASGGKLDVGDPVVFSGIRGAKTGRFEGTITRQSPSFGKGSHMMRAEVELDNPLINKSKKRALRPGDYGSATITLSDLKDVLAVPATAIGTSTNGSYVIQVAAGKERRRRVELLTIQDGWAAISGSLSAGDVVVANVVDHVKDD